jgi:hypothetical protein
MVALVLCGLAFLICFWAGRRSLAAGLVAVIGVGYFYGILRANVPSAFSHFIFDAGVLALFATQLFQPLTPEQRSRIQPLMPWLALLIGWPALLVLIPLQDPMVQLVGLRAHIFFLPFLILGARLSRDDVRKLTLWFAGLNLVVFGFAVAEFFLGVEAFYPRNEVTELIYRSRDINTATALGAFRIPATFGNSALYGSAMVMTLPLLLGLWVQKEAVNRSQRLLLLAAIVASALGVFLAAARMNMVALAGLVVVTLVSGRLGVAGRMAWVGMIAVVAYVVSLEERLFQRLMTLNVDTFIERLSWSVNSTLIDFTFTFPFGNGLGGGGSSIPHFLHHLIRNPVRIENQYGMLLLEQGIPGVFLWFAFIAWALTRRSTPAGDPWSLGRRLIWVASAAYLAQAVIGVGLLTAVPFTALFLLGLGWMVVQLPPEGAPLDAGQDPLFSDAEPQLRMLPLEPAHAGR